MCLGAQAGIWSCQTAWDLSRSSSTCGSQHFWRQVCALCSLGWSTLAAVELFLLRPGWLNKQGGYLEPFIHTKCSKHLELHIFITSIYLGSWLSEIPTATLDFKYVEGGHELKRWEPFFYIIRSVPFLCRLKICVAMSTGQRLLFSSPYPGKTCILFV